eukprot:572644-Amorphochlora_amoeboformis.AAC.1
MSHATIDSRCERLRRELLRYRRLLEDNDLSHLIDSLERHQLQGIPMIHLTQVDLKRTLGWSLEDIKEFRGMVEDLLWRIQPPTVHMRFRRYYNPDGEVYWYDKRSMKTRYRRPGHSKLEEILAKCGLDFKTVERK